jgi:hypothetical protein
MRHRRLRTLIYWGCPALLFLAAALGFYTSLANPTPPTSWVLAATVLGLAGILPIGLYQQHYIKGRVHGRQALLSGAGPRFLDSIPTEPEDA